MTKKQKAAAYNCEYHRKNRKKHLEQMAAYYRKNRKKLAKQQAARYRKNCKKFRKQARAYHRKNRKKILKQMAAYRRKNRKKILKQMVRWYYKNRKNLLKYKATYRHKMVSRHSQMLSRHKRLALRGIKGQPMSLKAHQKKLYYADGRERLCYYCWGENNKTGSGLDRLDNNITYTVKNTVPACRGCNVWRGSTHSVQETLDHFKPMRGAAAQRRVA